MTFGGIRDVNSLDIWKTPIPLKIKIFFWLAIKGKIQVAKQLKMMNWKGSPNCKLCGQEEDVDHLIFRCAPAQFVWCCVGDAFKWDSVPTSRSDLFDIMNSRGDKRKYIWLTLFAACFWLVWLMRNDWVFNNKLLANVNNLPYKVIFFITVEKASAYEAEGRFGYCKGLIPCQYPRDRRH